MHVDMDSWRRRVFDPDANIGFCRNSRARLRRELEWLASKGQRVELVRSARCSVFERIELALLEHVHGLDACDEGASAAKRNDLNPSMGRTMRLIARWSCSTRLSRHFD